MPRFIALYAFLVALLVLVLLIGVVGYLIWWDFSVSFRMGGYCALGVGMAAGCVYLLGCLLPKTKSHASILILQAPIELVWSVITDFEHRASWYEGIAKTELLRSTPETWRIIDTEGGKMDLKVTERLEPNMFAIEMLQYQVENICPHEQGECGDFTFTGTEQYALSGEGEETRMVHITQVVEESPILRVISTCLKLLPKAHSQFHAKLMARLDSLQHL